MQAGTQDKFIVLAIEWAEKAEKIALEHEQRIKEQRKEFVICEQKCFSQQTRIAELEDKLAKGYPQPPKETSGSIGGKIND